MRFDVFKTGYMEPVVIRNYTVNENLFSAHLKGGTLENCRIIKLLYLMGELKNCEVGSVFFDDKNLPFLKADNCKIHAIAIDGDKIDAILEDKRFFDLVERLQIEGVIIRRRFKGSNLRDFKNTDFTKLKNFKAIYISGDARVDSYLTKFVSESMQSLPNPPKIVTRSFDYFGISEVNTWETPWFDAKRMKLPYSEY